MQHSNRMALHFFKLPHQWGSSCEMLVILQVQQAATRINKHRTACSVTPAAYRAAPQAASLLYAPRVSGTGRLAFQPRDVAVQNFAL